MKGAAHWLALRGLLSLLSYSTRTTKLGVALPMVSWTSTDLPIGQSNGGIFLS